MTTDASSVLLTILSVVTGFGVKWATDVLEDRRRVRREREARRESRREFLQQRRSDFQRQNLLDLQDAAMNLIRSGARQHHADVMAFKETGKWQGHLLPEDVSDECALAQRSTTTLMVRIEDDETRHLVDALKRNTSQLGDTADLAAADRLLSSAAKAHDTLNNRIGEVLRNLDQEDAAAVEA
jgi:hypothetical protein